MLKFKKLILPLANTCVTEVVTNLRQLHYFTFLMYPTLQRNNSSFFSAAFQTTIGMAYLLLKSSFKVLTDHLAYSQHVLHDPGTECNDDGFYLRKYPPMSPRNRIMYLLTNGEEGLYLTLKKCCELPAEENIDTENTQIPDEEPSKNKRKQCSRTMSVTAHAVFESVGCNLTSQLNSANQNHTLYTKFKEQLITDGLIKWRYHDEVKDVCVMTDYSSTTGLLLPQSFVHVTTTKIHNNETVLRCTCDIFNIIKRAGHQETPLWPEDDEVVPDASLTCLHCCFYRDHLMGLYEKLQNTQNRSEYHRVNCQDIFT